MYARKLHVRGGVGSVFPPQSEESGECLHGVAELSKIQGAVCGFPFESRNKELRIMTIVCAAITYTAVFLRFMSRLVLVQTFGIDDWFIVAAATSDAVFTFYGVLRRSFSWHLASAS